MAGARKGGATIANRLDRRRGARGRGAKRARLAIGGRSLPIGDHVDRARAPQCPDAVDARPLTEARLPADERPEPEPARSGGAGLGRRTPAPLPPGAWGVLVDSRRSDRFVLAGDPVGERVLEFTLGEAPSFDRRIRVGGAKTFVATSTSMSA